MSTSDLAFRVGVTEGAIRQLESGRTKSPSFAIGLKIARVLDVDPWGFCMGEEDAPGKPQAGSLKERVARLESRLDRLERLSGTRVQGGRRT